MKKAANKFTLAICLSLVSHTLFATSLTEATDELCQTIKTCGQEQLKQQNLPPEMAQMMEGMFDGMCQSMVAPYVLSTKDAGLEDKAIACLESFNSKSCDELMNNNGGDTPECKDFQKAADEAYPDGNFGQ
jgi:hypothetical protein